MEPLSLDGTKFVMGLFEGHHPSPPMDPQDPTKHIHIMPLAAWVAPPNGTYKSLLSYMNMNT